MDKNEKKREISPILRSILTLDAQLTEAFVKCGEKLMPLKQLKTHGMALEISCHGILWIASTLASLWIFNKKSLYQMQVNLLMGLLLDIVIVAILKATVRRRRPIADVTSRGPDKYSFPSGHASRAMLVLYFFLYLWPVLDIYLPPLLAWVSAVVLSRLLIKKHYILDITFGMLLGYIEGMLVGFLYLNEETCLSLVSWVTDEKVSGADE